MVAERCHRDERQRAQHALGRVCEDVLGDEVIVERLICTA